MLWFGVGPELPDSLIVVHLLFIEALPAPRKKKKLTKCWPPLTFATLSGTRTFAFSVFAARIWLLYAHAGNHNHTVICYLMWLDGKWVSKAPLYRDDCYRLCFLTALTLLWPTSEGSLLLLLYFTLAWMADIGAIKKKPFILLMSLRHLFVGMDWLLVVCFVNELDTCHAALPFKKQSSWISEDVRT